jgi:signal transduction histidine kinase
MCTPILVRGRAVACFYVTHRNVGGLFGEVEKQLAEFIAVLAGTALENSEGFAEISALTESLTASNLELDQSLRQLRETQQRLIQSEKMAMAGQLAGGVAHDFNNLLTVIGGNTDLAQMACRDQSHATPSQREALIAECLTEIQEAGQRAVGLTRQLLTFSRHEPHAGSHHR